LAASNEAISVFHPDQFKQKLSSRRITVNPFEGLIQGAKPWLKEANLWAAVHVDKHSWLPPLLCFVAATFSASVSSQALTKSLTGFLTARTFVLLTLVSSDAFNSCQFVTLMVSLGRSL
jgi:hypothetical protein